MYLVPRLVDTSLTKYWLYGKERQESTIKLSSVQGYELCKALHCESL